MSARLKDAISRLRRRPASDRLLRSPRVQAHGDAFRALVDERLRHLERQIDEVKGRVNGLLFLLAGTVAAQLILRLLA